MKNTCNYSPADENSDKRAETNGCKMHGLVYVYNTNTLIQQEIRSLMNKVRTYDRTNE